MTQEEAIHIASNFINNSKIIVDKFESARYCEFAPGIEGACWFVSFALPNTDDNESIDSVTETTIIVTTNDAKAILLEGL